MLAKLFLALCFSVSAYAETRTYLVYRKDNFPQDRYLYTASPQEFKTFIDTGKKTITEAGGQPFRITSYEISWDGKYALWNVSHKDDTEKWHIDSMEQQGYIVLLSSMDIISENMGNRGIVTSGVYSGELSKIPTDFYRVAMSTP